MALDPLLHCSICPPKPTFSDVSHLLTHVGSKGHLANLHKLQVQGQYDHDAASKVNNYNTWFASNDLAARLTQRQVQKEAKKASKKTFKVEDKDNHIKADDDIEATAPIRHMHTTGGRGTKRSAKLVDDDSDEDYVPVGTAQYNPGYAYETPIKRSGSNDSFLINDIQDETKIDLPSLDGLTPKDIKTPNQAKLKGVIWPGMGLYDAARLEDQKKRNQKKDGSVVKRLEMLAGLVERKEVVHSFDLTVKKERDIDNLEDASSLVDGESPVPKRPIRAKKRKALAPLDANVPRFARKKNKPANMPSPGRGRGRGRRASRPAAAAARGQDNSPPRRGRLPSPTCQRRNVKKESLNDDDEPAPDYLGTAAFLEPYMNQFMQEEFPGGPVMTREEVARDIELTSQWFPHDPPSLLNPLFYRVPNPTGLGLGRTPNPLFSQFPGSFTQHSETEDPFIDFDNNLLALCNPFARGNAVGFQHQYNSVGRGDQVVQSANSTVTNASVRGQEGVKGCNDELPSLDL